MFIELSRKLAGNLGIELSDEKAKLTDEAWVMTVFSCTYPKKESFMLLIDANTDLMIVHKLKSGWRKDVPGAIREAFENFFEEAREICYEIGAYREELEEFTFVGVPHKDKDVANILSLFEGKFKGYYKSLPKDQQNYFTSEFAFDRIVQEYNLDDELGESSLNTFSGDCSYFYDEGRRPEVPFEENIAALKEPHVLKRKRNKRLSLIEEACLDIKEPQQENGEKFLELEERLYELYLRLMDASGSEKKDLRELYRGLKKEQLRYLTLPSTPYSNDLYVLRDADKFPEEMVFEFTVTLLLGGLRQVVRTVRVDADMTFADFEKLLNRLFRWKGFPYHLSGFYFSHPDEPLSKDFKEALIHENVELSKKSNDGLLDEARSEIDVTQGITKKDIKDVKLRDYFPKHSTAQYRYDFRDNWMHALELTDVFDKKDYKGPLPYLVDAIGVAPPENFGGSIAFLDLWRVNDEAYDAPTFKREIKRYYDEKKYRLKAPCDLSTLFEEEVN